MTHKNTRNNDGTNRMSKERNIKTEGEKQNIIRRDIHRIRIDFRSENKRRVDLYTGDDKYFRSDKNRYEDIKFDIAPSNKTVFELKRI